MIAPVQPQRAHCSPQFLVQTAAVALGFLDWLWRVMVWGDFAREKQQCDSIFE
jgi:hypothetical protein